MNDVWEPQLQRKIDKFIDRKAKEFPELNLHDYWYESHDQVNPRYRYRIKGSVFQ